MDLADIKTAIANLDSREIAELSEWFRINHDALTGKSSSIKPQQKGRQMEQYVAQLIEGTLMRGSAPYDVVSGDGVRLEVKYAALSPLKGGAGTCRNWTWSYLLGAGRDKEYDRLILIAAPNPLCKSAYLEIDAPYILFDVPFAVLPIIMNVNIGAIQLNSDPDAVRRTNEKHLRLYKEFQLTHRQLVDRYRLQSRI